MLHLLLEPRGKSKFYFVAKCSITLYSAHVCRSGTLHVICPLQQRAYMYTHVRTIASTPTHV